MRSFDAAGAAVFAADAATAAAAAWNTAWLATHWLHVAPGARRNATFSLATLNAGIAVQAAFAQALYSAHRFDLETAPLFDAAPWLASRALLLAGVLLISVLILRRGA